MEEKLALYLKRFGQEGFASGLTGFGGKIDKYGHAEFDSLTLRRFLEVPELRYNRCLLYTSRCV